MTNIKNSILDVIDKELSAIESLKDLVDNDLEALVLELANTKGKIIVSGVGKSGDIGKKISSTLTSTGSPSIFLNPCDALHGDLGIISKDDVILFLSNSGETTELLDMLSYAKAFGIKVFSITNRKDSTLAKNSDISITLRIEKEACPLNLAPSSSTSAMLVLGDAIAITLLKLKGFTKEDFAKLHPAGALGRKLKKLSEIGHFGEEVPFVKEGDFVKDAIIEMSKKGFGATIVLDDKGDLFGIITDGDIRRFIEKDGDIKTTRAKDIATKNPKTIDMDELGIKALNIMEENKITVLIIEKDKKPIGIVHLHDILRIK